MYLRRRVHWMKQCLLGWVLQHGTTELSLAKVESKGCVLTSIQPSWQHDSWDDNCEKRGAISTSFWLVRRNQMLIPVERSCFLCYNSLLNSGEKGCNLEMCEGTIFLTCSLFFMNVMYWKHFPYSLGKWWTTSCSA